ncbi:hypothetical protein OTERR_07380 [Oryzomicrobium terrae]|uniref:DUF2474 domain-containing protein n=1 Tax=Oryzomicrobium terrae TaxID=1735038 RepID=A0A5C1E6F4_9RHOO|nr:hypothetical protein OTERR_07380 [Oryzomicrobium terrae]
MTRGEGSGRSPWGRRLGWLVLIWAASVATLAVAAWLLRLLMQAAGFNS